MLYLILFLAIIIMIIAAIMEAYESTLASSLIFIFGFIILLVYMCLNESKIANLKYQNIQLIGYIYDHNIFNKDLEKKYSKELYEYKLEQYKSKLKKELKDKK